MKKVRTIINVVLGAMISALGLTSCEPKEVVVIQKYGVPIDTTVHVMYGVPDPQPIQQDTTTPQDDNEQ